MPRLALTTKSTPQGEQRGGSMGGYQSNSVLASAVAHDTG